MKKTIIAALVLAAASFSAWSPSQLVNQVSLLRGCGVDAGKTAIAISTPSFPGGYNTPQLLVTNTDPLYSNILEAANLSITSGKNIVVEYLSTKTTFNYQTTTNPTCYPSEFLQATNFTLKRQ